jgi:ketosteroid isomerase-like protein
MTSTTRETIQKEEEQLRQAMLESDINSLDNLLDMELIFTTHTGHILSKKQDLDAHKSGFIKIDQITNTEEKMQIHDETVIVSVKSHIQGTFGGEESSGVFRFTRIWAKTPSGFWRVVAGHSSMIQE